MNGLFKKINRFENHHRILVFSTILVGTIALIRLAVKAYDPNPILFDLELHHFDYGLILLLITVKLLLFGSRKYDNLYLVLAATASGLVIDEYVFIRQIVTDGPASQQIYNSSLPYVLIALVIGTLTILFINSIRKK